MSKYILQIIAGLVLLAGICLLALAAHMSTNAFGAVCSVVGSAATYLFGQRAQIVAALGKLRKR